PDSDRRLAYAIKVANTLLDLPRRAMGQLELLIAAQTEIRDYHRAAEHDELHIAAKLLGDAYRDRARSHGEADLVAEAADLNSALEAYLEAWRSLPVEHDHRLT